MSQHPSTPDPDVVRVLVVDDSEDMRFLVRWALERDGSFRVVAEAADGHEAVARLDASTSPISCCWTSPCPA